MATFNEYKTRLVNGGDFFVEIKAGQTVSTAINVFGSSILAFLFDSSLSPSNSLTFLASIDGINFYQLVDAYSGNPITVSAEASKYARILPTDFVGVQAIKVVSSIAQANDTKIKLICGPLL